MISPGLAHPTSAPLGHHSASPGQPTSPGHPASLCRTQGSHFAHTSLPLSPRTWRCLSRPGLWHLSLSPPSSRRLSLGPCGVASLSARALTHEPLTDLGSLSFSMSTAWMGGEHRCSVDFRQCEHSLDGQGLDRRQLWIPCGCGTRPVVDAVTVSVCHHRPPSHCRARCRPLIVQPAAVAAVAAACTLTPYVAAGMARHSHVAAGTAQLCRLFVRPTAIDLPCEPLRETKPASCTRLRDDHNATDHHNQPPPRPASPQTSTITSTLDGPSRPISVRTTAGLPLNLRDNHAAKAQTTLADLRECLQRLGHATDLYRRPAQYSNPQVWLPNIH